MGRAKIGETEDQIQGQQKSDETKRGSREPMVA
jgi:hypothetical protein